MHLAFDLSWTHLEGRWRNLGSWTGRTYPNLGILTEVAMIAERGGIDMLFFGDGTGIPSTWRGSRDAAIKWGMTNRTTKKAPANAASIVPMTEADSPI